MPLRGLFRTPSVRDPDKRPYPGFVKALRHNGVFGSLPEVVHRAVDANSNEVAFNLRNGSPASTTPLFPPPEVLDDVPNVAALSPGSNEG